MNNKLNNGIASYDSENLEKWKDFIKKVNLREIENYQFGIEYDTIKVENRNASKDNPEEYYYYDDNNFVIIDNKTKVVYKLPEVKAKEKRELFDKLTELYKEENLKDIQKEIVNLKEYEMPGKDSFKRLLERDDDKSNNSKQEEVKETPRKVSQEKKKGILESIKDIFLLGMKDLVQLPNEKEDLIRLDNSEKQTLTNIINEIMKNYPKGDPNSNYFGDVHKHDQRNNFLIEILELIKQVNPQTLKNFNIETNVSSYETDPGINDRELGPTTYYLNNYTLTPKKDDSKQEPKEFSIIKNENKVLQKLRKFLEISSINENEITKEQEEERKKLQAEIMYIKNALINQKNQVFFRKR